MLYVQYDRIYELRVFNVTYVNIVSNTFFKKRFSRKRRLSTMTGGFLNIIGSCFLFLIPFKILNEN